MRATSQFVVFIRSGLNDYTYVDGQLVEATYYRNEKSDSLLDMDHNWFIGTFSGNNPHHEQAILA